MKSEDKELLVRDLSARLPYGVICQYNCVIPCGRITLEKTNERDVLKGIIPMYDGHIGFMVGIDKVNAIEGDIKPYLRPMSSMTEEEKEELNCLCYHNIGVQDNMLQGYLCGSEINDVIDWLISHHFDYRTDDEGKTMIENGLAIEVTEKNNPYK